MLSILLAAALLQAPTAPLTDSMGFGPLMNQYRAQCGLRPLVHDANLSAWAGSNNAAQRRISGAGSGGLGHHVTLTGAWQAAGWGYQSAQSVLVGWVNSPSHRNVLLANATCYGISFDGIWWSLNVR